MSREEQQHYLKVAELAYTALNAGKIEAVVKLSDEEIEIGGSESRSGHEGLREWFEAQSDSRRGPTEVLPIGNQHMVVMVRTSEGEGADMLEFRAGRIAALHFYATRDEAVAAAKQREADSADD